MHRRWGSDGRAVWLVSWDSVLGTSGAEGLQKGVLFCGSGLRLLLLWDDDRVRPASRVSGQNGSRMHGTRQK